METRNGIHEQVNTHSSKQIGFIKEDEKYKAISIETERM